MENIEKLKFLTSLKVFCGVFLLVLFFFNFLDIMIFELSRSFPGIIFIFFRKFIDPLSDIFDPFVLIVLCSLILLLNSNIKHILRNEKKLNIIKKQTGFSFEKISLLFKYLSLVCKHFIISLAVAGILCNIFKYIIGVSRPKYFFLEGYDRFNFFNIDQKVNSFPSGHTQAAFTLAMLLIIYLNKYTLYILIFSILMGLSRIFMSMHFPSDLIAGAYLGSVIPILTYNYFYRNDIEKIKSKQDVLIIDIVKLLYWRFYI